MTNSFRRIIVLLIAMLIVLLCGCSKEYKPSKELYYYDIANKKSTLLLTAKSDQVYYDWSKDDKYFLVFDKNDKNRLYIYKTKDLSEIKLPNNLIDKSLDIFNAFWLDSENIIFQTNDEEYQYSIGNSSIELYKSKEEKSPKDLVTIEDPEEIQNKIGEKFFEGQFSESKDIFLYNNFDKETYLYDLKTGKKKYLFKGLGLRWSPTETKISYYALKPKYSGFDPYNIGAGYIMDTYIYDIKTGNTLKIADKCVNITFSMDENFILYMEDYYRCQAFSRPIE